MSLAYYKTDKEAEIEGKWFDLVGGGQVKLARIGNKNYAKLREKLEKPYAKLMRAGKKPPEDKQDEILIETFSRTIVLDWKGIIDPRVSTEAELPFNYENVKSVLTEYRDFLDEIAQYAADMENYRSESQEQDLKN